MTEIDYVTEKRNLIIKEGDTVRIRPASEIDADDRLGLIDLGWNPCMYVLCGKEFKVTADMVYRSLRGERDIFHVQLPERRVSISLSMLELVDDQPKEIEKKELKTLHAQTQDPAILQEMIKKVDKMRFTKLLSIAGADGRVKPDTIKNDIVTKYLTEWAKAKYDFYLLFNHNLSLNKQVDMEMDTSDMEDKLRDLMVEHPQYANLIKGFGTVEFMNNECYGYNETLASVYAPYRSEAKLTKILAGLVTEQKFIDDVANLLEDRKIKSNIALSIDPYDYLTMSINQYGWSTCQTIGSGQHPYATGAGSIMLDNHTIIAYRYGEKNVTYSMSNMKFSGNSKSWRQLIFVDKDNCSFITGREYPSAKEGLAKEVRLMLEHELETFLGRQDESWVVANNGSKEYTEGSENLYHDVSSGYKYRTVYLKDTNKTVRVQVGKDVFCVLCGNPIQGSHPSYVCEHCSDETEFGCDENEEDDTNEDIPY